MPYFINNPFVEDISKIRYLSKIQAIDSKALFRSFCDFTGNSNK